MKQHVLNALREEFLNRPMDYEHLTVHRGALHTPKGKIPLKRLGKGTFADVYEEKKPVLAKSPAVFAFVNKENYDKDVLVGVEPSPHLPTVNRYGSTEDSKVYVMPKYKSPLRQKDSAGWRDYKKLKGCASSAFARRGPGASGMEKTVECARHEGVRPQVVEALSKLAARAENFSSDYMFDILPKNLATDKKGNLVLLDVLFDMSASQRRR